MWLVFVLFLILNGNPIKCQFISNEQTVSICSDEYKINSYSLECQPGQGVTIVKSIQKFEKQNAQNPDCLAEGSLNYNYSKPFADFCNGKMICTISSAFLDENKLFDAETYFLPDNTYYLKPYRIDITFDCSSKPTLTSTRPVNTQTTTQIITETTIPMTTTTTITTTTTTPQTTTTTPLITTTFLTNFTINSTISLPVSNSTDNNNNNYTSDMFNMTETSSSKYYKYFSDTTTTEHKLKTGSISVYDNDEFLINDKIGFNYFTIASKMTSFEYLETHTTTSSSTTTTPTTSTTTSTTSTTSSSTTTSSTSTTKFSSTTNYFFNTKKERINLENTTKFLNISGDLKSVVTTSSTSTITGIQRSKESSLKTTLLLQTSRINPNTETVLNDKINNNSNSNNNNDVNNGKTSNNIVYSNLKDLKNKLKSFKEPGATTATTTKVDSYVGNSETDRTVMIVLIVLGCVFFLIILAIAVLICIRRRNQAKLDREFGYKNDYNGEDTYSNDGNMSTIGGSVRDRHQISGPFSEISGAHSSRNMENLAGTYGTYRSRSNDGYDNSDKSLNSVSGRIDISKRPRIDNTEYWRTNV
ncbi:unnamed protein product [Brachionus calyciflorus]|uniref:Uncharacterized protein n=1 Tax=Brachionus calyciflorus TaxID=104777 RepID=A0A813UIK3_9BILA|nr:unnamed protein product [Brachionus calyciflorus]